MPSLADEHEASEQLATYFVGVYTFGDALQASIEMGVGPLRFYGTALGGLSQNTAMLAEPGLGDESWAVSYQGVDPGIEGFTADGPLGSGITIGWRSRNAVFLIEAAGPGV